MSRPLVENSIGHIPLPQDIHLDKDGRVTESQILYLTQYLGILASALNGNLNIGDGAQGTRSGNLFGQFITVLTPTVVDTEFRVDHGLQRLPIAVLPVTNDSYGRVKASNTPSWTSETIYLKCDAASATIRLWLM